MKEKGRDVVIAERRAKQDNVAQRLGYRDYAHRRQAQRIAAIAAKQAATQQ